MAYSPRRPYPLPNTREVLKDTILLLTSSRSQSARVAAVKDIATCLGSDQPSDALPNNYIDRGIGNEQQITSTSTIFLVDSWLNLTTLRLTPL